MFDLNQLAAPLIPHFETVRDTCEQWGHRICAQLDGIHDALLDEGIDERRARISVNLTPGMARLPIGEIGVGEAWQLENYSLNLSAVGPFVIRADDEPVFARTPTTPQAGGFGENLIVPGRATLTIESPGAGAGRMYLQFQRRVPRPVRARRYGGGQQEVTPASPRTLAPLNQHVPAYPLDTHLVRR